MTSEAAPLQRARDDETSTARLLSVAELQLALRQARAERPAEETTPDRGTAEPASAAPMSPPLPMSPPPLRPSPLSSPGPTAVVDAAAADVTGVSRRPATTAPAPLLRDAGWWGSDNERAVLVCSAHAGAGASTVALAIADAAAAAGHTCQLVGLAEPTECGLVAVTSAELGADPTGCWIRGRRGGVMVDRLAQRPVTASPHDLPARCVWNDDGADPSVIVVDGGVQPAPSGAPVTVLVCRATVPGVLAAERRLACPTPGELVVALVGPPRCPATVRAALGPRLRAIRDAGALVPVPIDRRLEVTGLTAGALPRPVTTAGKRLTDLVLRAHLGAATSSLRACAGHEGDTSC